MRNIKKIFPLILLVIVPTIQGCKVSYTFTGASIPPEAKTFSVQLFQNLASIVNPTLSSYFTEELKNRFITQTSLNQVDDFGDFAFSGQITQYNVAPVAIQGNEVAAQNRLTISVKVKFTNAIEPKQSFEKSFTQYENFNSTENFTSVESDLVQKIVEKLVDDIFNASAANW
ncbi:MAG: LptE family protein [Bacteroidales bacterium]|nr:LptE family protein [Bacteroidales bacterium]HPD94945.1 LptE family protein [Tenuifilaceae bacterium]HRX31317.1 LptE family protein [Tenuifilaceae bacterium]